MIYKILKNQRFELAPYAIVPIRSQDMLRIKEWRNAQIDVLRQKSHLTDDDQRKYFENVVARLFEQDQPIQILVSYLKDDVPIGYGGIVHIDWADRRGEVSFLLDPARISEQTYTKEFSVFLGLIKKLAWELSLNRLYTETFDIRDLHIKVLESSGFLLEGRMRQHVLIKGQFYDSLIHGCLRKDENI